MTTVKSGLTSLAAIAVLSACASTRGSEPIERRVSRLVDETTTSEMAARNSFRELESLESQAAPYLVGHLSDVRPLATSEIAFENKSTDAFEGVRHYRPSTVHDALSAILNSITGESFVFVYNGATSQDREENRRRWVSWCRSTYPDQTQICSGK